MTGDTLEKRKQWAEDHYHTVIDQVQRLVRQPQWRHATKEQDLKRCMDVVVEGTPSWGAAVRVRHVDYLSSFGHQVTIRTPHELAKIQTAALDSDVMVYTFVCDRHLVWGLTVLDMERLAVAVNQLTNPTDYVVRHNYVKTSEGRFVVDRTGQRVPDGTGFRAYSVARLEVAAPGCVLFHRLDLDPLAPMDLFT